LLAGAQRIFSKSPRAESTEQDGGGERHKPGKQLTCGTSQDGKVAAPIKVDDRIAGGVLILAANLAPVRAALRCNCLKDYRLIRCDDVRAALSCTGEKVRILAASLVKTRVEAQAEAVFADEMCGEEYIVTADMQRFCGPCLQLLTPHQLFGFKIHRDTGSG
jgi:hypothetical protein